MFYRRGNKGVMHRDGIRRVGRFAAASTGPDQAAEVHTREGSVEYPNTGGSGAQGPTRPEHPAQGSEVCQHLSFRKRQSETRRFQRLKVSETGTGVYVDWDTLLRKVR